MRIVTKLLRLESRGFRYKVALYLSCLHIHFDDEIGRKFPSNYKHNIGLTCVQS